MIKTQADLRNHNIIGRERAALIASTASRFQSTLTLERDGIVLNLKSMIGLLSQTIPKDGLIWVVADGVDEQAATDAVMSVLTKQLCFPTASLKTQGKAVEHALFSLRNPIFLFLAGFSTPYGNSGKTLFRAPFVERFCPLRAGNTAVKREMVSSSSVRFGQRQKDNGKFPEKGLLFHGFSKGVFGMLKAADAFFHGFHSPYYYY